MDRTDVERAAWFTWVGARMWWRAVVVTVWHPKRGAR
jgi:hypothetical protein